ncbi:MAG: glycosyltransferase [Candidatus Micrarchaeota archaeon]|nr:glycosyltransferase [Candidatus Micrarchaeota archaeon]
MKVLINSLEVGGAERSIANLSKYMDLDIYTIYNNSSFPEVKYTPILDFQKLNGTMMYMLTPIIISRMLRMFRKEDVLVSHLNQSNFMNFVLKKMIDHSMISVIHHLYLNRRIPLERQVLNSSDLVVCVSEHMRLDLVERYGLKNSVTVYNSIDLNNIKRLSDEDLDVDFEYLVNVGRFVDFKNQIFLIDLFAKIREKIPDMRLLLIGYGDLERTLIQRAKTRGLSVSKDVQERADIYIFRTDNVYKYMKHARAYVHVSRNEGFGMTLLEALTLDIPVITSDYKHGSREALGIYDFDTSLEYPYRTDLGVLFPVATSVESKEGKIWMENLPKLLDEYSRVPGERFVTERFHPRVIAERWKNIFKTF